MSLTSNNIIQTVGGELKICSAREFISTIKCNQIRGDGVTIHTTNYNSSFSEFGMNEVNKIYLPVKASVEVTDREAALSGFRNLTNYLHVQAFEKIMMQELGTFVSKKPANYYCHNLNLAFICDVSNRLFVQTGREITHAVHFNLSPYQKFLLLLNAECFEFYHTERMPRMDRASAVYRGALADLNPEGWVAVCYENGNLHDDFARQRMYTGGLMVDPANHKHSQVIRNWNI